jgi:hypothetical protein
MRPRHNHRGNRDNPGCHKNRYRCFNEAQLANQGPKLGEQGHFRRAAESGTNGDLSYALRRFDNEAHRIYGVMNRPVGTARRSPALP